MKTTKMLAILVLAIGLVGRASAALPPGWYEASTPGSASYDEANESWAITGEGFSAHYVYMCLKGDGQIIAYVSEVYGCAGVGISDMISSSKYAQVYVDQTKAWFVDSITANPGIPVRGGPSYPNVGIEGPPYWVLLDRTGDMFTGYVSPDGLPPWTKVGSKQILMSTNTWIQLRIRPGLGGLMASSSSANFDKVSVIGDTEFPNNGWVVVEPNMYSTVPGNVGIGTTNPTSKLEVMDSSSNSALLAINNGLADCSGVMGVASNTGDVQNYGGFFSSEGKSGVGVSALSTGSEGVGVIAMGTGEGGTGILASGELLAGFFDGHVIISGDLDINGSIYQRGSRLHADYVFQPGYELESIDEHSKFMWQHGHLEAIPKAQVDGNGQEIIEVGAHRKGIVEELEKAHIYIEQLNNRIKALEEKLAKLEAGLSVE